MAPSCSKLVRNPEDEVGAGFDSSFLSSAQIHPHQDGSKARCRGVSPSGDILSECLGQEDYRRKKRNKRSESTTLRRIEVVSGKKNVKFRR
jgi:hypothetical protein